MDPSAALSLGIDIGGSSIKCAAIQGDRIVWTRSSPGYHKPGAEELAQAMKGTITPVGGRVGAVGLCAPGLLDRAARTISAAVNLPGLVGVSLDDLVRGGVGADAPAPLLLTDTRAAAHHLYHEQRMPGRLLLLALGTGVGAAVIDAMGPVLVDGESPGHFGQLDVSVEGSPVIGPDGGAGGLEGYIGAAALQARYGETYFDRIRTLAIEEPPLLALVRAIRIGHAMFRPDHVCLTGAIGNALLRRVEALRGR
jgi:predicted NBD/HSP70 family sugar kinase